MNKLNKKLIALLSCSVLLASPMAYAEDTASIGVIGGADGKAAVFVAPTASAVDESTYVDDYTPAPPKAFTVQVEKDVLGANAQPLIVEGRSFLPFRVLFSALGAEVAYDASAKTITAKLDDKDIVLTVGSKIATVNGSETTLLSAPIISNDSAYIPVRDVANITGREVEYSSAEKKVNVYDAEKFIADIDSNFTIYNEILQNSSANQLNKTYKSTINLAGDLEIYDIEEDTKKFSGEVNFDGLTKGMDLNGTFDVKVNLKDFEKNFTDMSFTAEDLALLKDILAAKHQIILDSKKSVMYIKSDAVANILGSEKDTWFKMDGAESFGNLNALYMGQLGNLINNPKEATLGKILYETTKMQQETFAAQGMAEYMPSVYDQLTLSSKMVQLMMGDDGFAKSGSTYTMTLNKESLKARIIKFFPEAAGEINAIFNEDIEALNYKLVLSDTASKNPKIEWKIDGRIKDASTGTISFDMDLVGSGNTESTMKMSVTVPKYGKFKLDLKSKSSETNQTINLAPPQGAKIEDLF